MLGYSAEAQQKLGTSVCFPTNEKQRGNSCLSEAAEFCPVLCLLLCMHTDIHRV